MRRLLTIPMLLLLCHGANADDFFDTVETRRKVSHDVSESRWRQRAWLQQRTGFGYRAPAADFNRDRAEWTRVETELYGEMDWRHENWHLRVAGSLVHDWLPDLGHAGIWSGYELTPAQRDARRWHWEGSDSYLSWQDADWWIKAGYLTLAWGEAETLKVTDVLARRDQRWPGQEDLEELRLPVPAILVSWRNALDLVLLPEIPADRMPDAFDEFDPYIRLRDKGSWADPTVVTQRDNSPGWALRWQIRQPGVDAQVFVADTNNFEAAPISATIAGPPPTRLQELTVKPWRQQVAGLSLQTAQGPWLFKMEQAWHRGVQLEGQNPLPPWHDRNQWRAMVAAEYSGITDLSITSEFSWSYTQNHSSELASDQWQTGQALRLNYQAFNQRLALNGLTMRLVGGHGNLLRLAADWKVSDPVSLGVAIVEYIAGSPNQMLYDYRNNDALLLTLRWGLL